MHGEVVMHVCIWVYYTQQQEEVEAYKKSIDNELKAQYEEELRKKMEEKELRDSKEVGQ